VIPTTIEVGNNPVTAERRRQLLKEMETATGQMASLQPAITMLETLEKEGSIPEYRQEALNQARTVFQTLSENMVQMQAEMAEVEEELGKLGYGVVNVTQSAFPGVRVIIGSEQLLLETQYDHTTFSRSEEGVVFGPLRT